ncbi:MAG: hypothetical protein WBD19_19490, partial [Candidatus Acidiferrum sp.]
SGRVARKDPLKALPTGVRTEDTITASGIWHSSASNNDSPERTLFAAVCEKANWSLAASRCLQAPG